MVVDVLEKVCTSTHESLSFWGVRVPAIAVDDVFAAVCSLIPRICRRPATSAYPAPRPAPHPVHL